MSDIECTCFLNFQTHSKKLLKSLIRKIFVDHLGELWWPHYRRGFGLLDETHSSSIILEAFALQPEAVGVHDFKVLIPLAAVIKTNERTVIKLSISVFLKLSLYWIREWRWGWRSSRRYSRNCSPYSLAIRIHWQTVAKELRVSSSSHIFLLALPKHGCESHSSNYHSGYKHPISRFCRGIWPSTSE